MLDLYSLLAATDQEIQSATETIFSSAYDTFIGIVDVVLPMIIGVLVALAIILGIKVGITFARAEDDEGKKKAKAQLVNLLIGFIVAIVITSVIFIVLKSGQIKKLFKIGDTNLG